MKPLSVAATLAFSIATALGSASANAVTANVGWNGDEGVFYIYDIALSPGVRAPDDFLAFGRLTVTFLGGNAYEYRLRTVIPEEAFAPAIARAADDLGVDPRLWDDSEYGIFDFVRSRIEYENGEITTLAQIIAGLPGGFKLDDDGNIELTWRSNNLINGTNFEDAIPGRPPGIHFEYLNPVPEPETWAMLLAGLGIVGATARRRKP